ncbi:site-specific integrase [Sanguibacteroides justesenii]|uniref:Integrase n=1 Tax=Sanguibacteroides justesenii TaxID=1547597 RepID=A0A0C3RJT9_9PORP|nr:site-specific integrase [Sanguibacteroides justesenii]KIO46564.1 integrase [Sanguibacteroides justesenii]
MATVKVKFRASTIPTKEGTVFYQVIHNRVVRQVNPGYKLYPDEWDTANAEIVFPPGIESGRRNYLVSLKSALAEDVRRFKGIITRFERAARDYTAEEVAERFLVSADSGGFMSFGRELVRQLKQICKMRTAERYTTVLNSFGRFLGEKDVPLDEVDSYLMVEYEIFLHANDACPNTSSYYMRGLRAIYNRAVEKELTIQRSPFKHVYTGIDKTVKRAVPLKIIRQIRKLDLTLFPAMDFARDIFMFSFYTCGMSFVDMAYLKKKDLQNGILSYRRQKTGQLLFIKWERPMQEIIDKYDTGGSPYLLPIIKNVNADERWQYKNAAHLVNSKLKRLGEKLGLAMPLTSYVARHAWASIAKSKNVPLATISEAMGHDSEKTTRIYLASLDTSAVDKANSQILKSL